MVVTSYEPDRLTRRQIAALIGVALVKRQQQRVPRERVPGFEPVAVPAASSAAAADRGGIRRRRESKKDKAREAAGQVSKR
jgi:hypothetical protein